MIPSTLYVVRKTNSNIYEIATFVDGKFHSVYAVKYSRGYSCDCPGYWRQKDKTQHKHCLLVKFWVDYLDEGFCLWFDNDTIKYNRFIEKRMEFFL